MEKENSKKHAKTNLVLAIAGLLLAMAVGVGCMGSGESTRTASQTENLREIYVAAGCFWGVEDSYSKIPGVVDAVSGYANGTTENPNYLAVCTMDTGYAETVRISYDPSVVSLEDLVDHYFEIVDPIGDCKDSDCSKSQYRKGIYYTDEQDRAILEDIFAAKRAEIGEEPSVELEPIEVFYVAEDYHQDYQ